MFKKILLTILTFITFTQSNSLANIEKLSTYISPVEFEFYKQNQWEFLDDVFIKLKDDYVKEKMNNAKDFFKIIGSSLLGSVATGLTTFMIMQGLDNCTRLVFNLRPDETATPTYAFSGLLIGTFSIPIWEIVLLSQKLYKYGQEADLIILEDLIKNYELDISKTEFNLKKLVPIEFQPIFDQIKIGYEKSGIQFLNEHGLIIINKIRNCLPTHLKK